MGAWKVTFWNTALEVIDVLGPNDLMSLEQHLNGLGIYGWMVISAERIPQRRE